MARGGSALSAAILVLGIGALNAGSVDAAPPSFQALLNSDGSGSLRLVVLDGSTPVWQACAPDLSNCSPFATGTDVSTDGVAAGTVLWDGRVQSPVWNGNVSPLTPPSVSGAVRANELVTPVTGRWNGGWDGDFDRTQLAACRSKAGEECIALTNTEDLTGCPDGEAVIDPALTGDYLRVADRLFGPGTYFGPPGLRRVSLPYGGEVWAPGPTVSAEVVGRVSPARAPRTSNCGPPPAVRASISRTGTALVSCDLGCRAALIAKRGQRRARLVRALPAGFRLRPQERVETLRLSRRSLLRLGSGKARMIVEVDGKPTARRAIVPSGTR
ncbi:MAG TPA: hypothetical protein VH476_10250 [Solirubrobacterales bacterium]|jgi:hypothetical protein